MPTTAQRRDRAIAAVDAANRAAMTQYRRRSPEDLLSIVLARREDLRRAKDASPPEREAAEEALDRAEVDLVGWLIRRRYDRAAGVHVGTIGPLTLRWPVLSVDQASCGRHGCRSNIEIRRTSPSADASSLTCSACLSSRPPHGPTLLSEGRVICFPCVEAKSR